MIPQVIALDTFPLSSVAKREPEPGEPLTTLHRCQLWIADCLRAGHRIVTPAIAYYEVLRELERLGASRQIERLRQFCHAVPDRYLSLTDAHLDQAAKFWAQARNAGFPTASSEALDGDVILVAQVLSLGLASTEIVVATTNVRHLQPFVSAQEWSQLVP